VAGRCIEECGASPTAGGELGSGRTQDRRDQHVFSPTQVSGTHFSQIVGRVEEVELGDSHQLIGTHSHVETGADTQEIRIR